MEKHKLSLFVDVFKEPRHNYNITFLQGSRYALLAAITSIINISYNYTAYFIKLGKGCQSWEIITMHVIIKLSRYPGTLHRCAL